MKIILACVLVCCANHAGADEAYISSLAKNYGKRLIFVTEHARNVVLAFDIDCPSRDGRYVSLRNILLARLDRFEKQKIPGVITKADSRGQNIRISDVVKLPNGQVVEEVVMEINSWNELSSRNISTDAFLNTCFGSYGPIWEGGNVR